MPLLVPDDEPIRYMQRTRDWYLALGYDNPYRWAHFNDVPFQPLRKPLSECTVALVATAAPHHAEHDIQRPGAPYNAAAKFFKVYSGDSARDHDVRNRHVAIDFKHTTGEDSNAWFPLPLMRDLASQGRYRVAPRFHGMPTNRSQRRTIDIDCPELLARCREDGVDAAVLVPNCPVCHQTMSLAARHLEAHGIATVIMGCAKDIVEHCGVPRFVFSDFPLGNPCGLPWQRDMQSEIVGMALRLLETATGPRTTIRSPFAWKPDPEWRQRYNRVDAANRERLLAIGDQRRAKRGQAPRVG